MMRIIALVTMLLCVVTLAQASSYNYVSAAELQARLAGPEKPLLLDIQVEEEYRQHHIAGAVATYAYPVKTEADRGRLDAFVRQAGQSGVPVVIVCPRGGGGARRAYDYLAGKGISENRLQILEGGQAGWPY